MRPFVYVNNAMTLRIGNKIVTITQEHPQFNKIKAGLVNDVSDSRLLDLIEGTVEGTVINYLKSKSNGVAEYRNGKVYFNGVETHNAITNKVVELAMQDFPFEHMLRFLENVELNPDSHSRQELYDFLENKHLPITEDGCFLAYKAVNADYTDKYSGQFSNTPGMVISMPRENVDNNRNNHCSHGFHVGAIEYVMSYGQPEDIIMAVKVHPRDAVSVPNDSSFQKLRCCRYEVLHELEGIMECPVYNSCGQPLNSPVSNDVAFSNDCILDSGVDCDKYDVDEVTTYMNRCEDEDWYEEPEDEDDDFDDWYEQLDDEDEEDDPWTLYDQNYGIKPPTSVQAGRRYWNVRNNGRFTKR